MPENLLAVVIAGLLWLRCTPCDGATVVFVADAEFVRAWRENRP